MTTPDGDGPPELAATLADLAAALHDQPDTESTLRTVVERAVAVVPGARWAGISLARGRTTEPCAPSDPLVADLDGLQTRLDDGPCLTALRRHHVVAIDDVTTDGRWPHFTRAAARHGVGSVLSVPLTVHRDTVGALNLYADHAEAFDPTSTVVARFLAQHATIAVTASITQEQLQAAIASRDVIGQAKGIVMHRDHCTADYAFQLLREASQATNVKLVDVARWLVDTHEATATRRRMTHLSDE